MPIGKKQTSGSEDAILLNLLNATPAQLIQVANSKDYDQNTWYTYQQYKKEIWTTRIKADLGAAADAVQMDIDEYLLGRMDLQMQQNPLGLYTGVLQVVVDRSWNALADLQHPALDVPTLSVAIRALLGLNIDTIQQIQVRKWLTFARYSLRYDPTLLPLIVSIIPTYFYQQFSDNAFDFTHSMLEDVILFLNLEQKRKALPVVYDLFIRPNANNWSGLFNPKYSEETRRLIKIYTDEWYDIVPFDVFASSKTLPSTIS